MTFQMFKLILEKAEEPQIKLPLDHQKSKRERERYSQWNAEFQGLVRREKKVFLDEQYKEIEGNNRMGKTKDLFKKIKYQ